jgi:hypothetical protein
LVLAGVMPRLRRLLAMPGLDGVLLIVDAEATRPRVREPG